jgi:hypothetical protein
MGFQESFEVRRLMTRESGHCIADDVHLPVGDGEVGGDPAFDFPVGRSVDGSGGIGLGFCLGVISDRSPSESSESIRCLIEFDRLRTGQFERFAIVAR